MPSRHNGNYYPPGGVMRHTASQVVWRQDTAQLANQSRLLDSGELHRHDVQYVWRAVRYWLKDWATRVRSAKHGVQIVVVRAIRVRAVGCCIRETCKMPIVLGCTIPCEILENRRLNSVLFVSTCSLPSINCRWRSRGAGDARTYRLVLYHR